MSVDLTPAAKDMRAWRARRRQKLLDLLGHECKRCGSTKNLEVDHVDDDGAEHRKSVKGDMNKYYQHVLDHPEQYQILCASCNRKKAWDLKRSRGVS